MNRNWDPEFDDIKRYNGNPNLKKINQSIEWTPERIQEYIKCQNDIVYFVETYMKIINVDKGLINFQLYPYQKKMLKNFVENRFNIVTTARQAGKSTTTCAFILWYIIFHEDKTVALLANKGDTAREIMGRIILAYQNLPIWLQQGVCQSNKGSMSLENNSRVIASSTSSNNIRGYSINLLFIDEAAFIDNWDEFFTSVFPTISSGTETKIILVSTPNGLNHFHKTWEHAVQGRNEYKHIMVNWRDVPGRDEKWKQTILAGLNFDIEKFNQENECEFLGSSGTLIAGWKLKQLVDKMPMSKKDGLSMFYKVEEGHMYMLIADISRGKGLDYSAFHVIDVTKMPYQQVAVYRNNNIGPYDCAEVIYRLAKGYNNASVLIENNDIGDSVCNALHYDIGYEHLLYTENAGASGKRITAGFGSGGNGVEKGIRTTKKVKSKGCSIMKLLIEQDQLIINDDDTIMELKRFSRKGDSYQAEPGATDDLVMGLVLFGWITEEQYFKDYTDINTLHTLKEKSEEDLEQDMAPFGFVVTGGENIDAFDDIKVDSKSPDYWIWQSDFDDPYHGDYPLKGDF